MKCVSPNWDDCTLEIVMKGLFKQRVVFLRWVGLCLSAVVLAIALASILDSSDIQLLPAGDFALSVDPLAALNSDEPDFAVQERYGRRWLHYATVARSDDTFRQMFVDANAIERIDAGQPLPDETLILMESWYSPEAPSIIFIKQKLNGIWEYGSFNPAQPDYQVSNRDSCHRCHAPFPEIDFTLTNPLLEAALQRQAVQTAYCDRPGRSPCAPEAYHPSAEASS